MRSVLSPAIHWRPVTRKILVRVRDDAHARIAWAVASLPGLAPIGMLGSRPPDSWGRLVERAASSSADDIVVDPDARDLGLVVVAGTSDRPGITHASPEGLASCIAARIDGEPHILWTVEGTARRSGPSWAFPLPVGVVRGPAGPIPVGGDFAAVGAFGPHRSIVCVDDRPFMQTVCIAAGAAVASDDVREPTPVWERAEDYIHACEQLGLVFAEGVSS